MSESSVQAKQSLESLVGQVADEFLRRQEHGERPDVEEYAAQHPEAAELLRKVLVSLQMLELSHSGVSGTSTGEPTTGILGDFRLLQEIGRGGMGVVYEAEQISLGRRVALKVLPFAGTMDARQLQRFQNEARAAAGLHHTNIVPVHYVGSDCGVHYYAMQFIEGQDLASVIAQLRVQAGRKVPESRAVPTVDAADGEVIAPTTPTAANTPPLAGLSTERSTGSQEHFRTVARLGIQAAEALDHAHQMGIVHRDVKPANLLVDATGRLWVTDFGLAQIQSDTRMTMTGDLVGTLRYMSPEQALAKRVIVDHRTDIYSLGATLYELLTLEPAFEGRDRQELLRQIAFEEPRRPRRLNRAIPQELETIILKTLERNPADRYATAQELADDLRNFVEDRPIRAKRPSLLNRLGRWRRRHKALVLGVGAVVLTVLLLGGVALWKQQHDHQHQQAVLEGQRIALEKALGEDLREADLLQKQERWSEELQVVERASGRLASGGSPHLRASVEQRRKNVLVVARLEEARLQSCAVGRSGFDSTEADQEYAAAFATYGLNVEMLTPEEAAERIRTSPIRTQLVAALDDWAFCKKKFHAGSEEPLLVVARLADDDPWRQQLREPEMLKNEVALERLAETEGVLAQPPGHLMLLSRAFGPEKGQAAAVLLLRRAQARHPEDFWINFALAARLAEEPATSGEAVGFYRAAPALRPHSPVVYNNIGFALLKQKKPAEAEAASRKAIELKPDFAHAYNTLGTALRDQNKPAEAETAFRKVIDLQPDYAIAYYNLGVTLREQKRIPEEEAAYRKAIELRPDLADAHYNLGLNFMAQKKLPEAEAALRKAIEVQSHSAITYNNFDFARTYLNLGLVLSNQKKRTDAEAAFRRVIELHPNLALAHYFLGCTLRDQGRFADALVVLKRGHELGSKNQDTYWNPSDSANRVHEVERLVELDAKVPHLLNGEAKPANATECLEIAIMCQQYKTYYLAAVRFYEQGFAAQPALAEDLRWRHRYNAACAASLAGCGQGKDAEHLDAQEFTRLRKQALDWLRTDLTAWKNVLEKNKYKAASVLGEQLQHWLDDPDFNGVRGAEALAKLPEAERDDWKRLWVEVEELRRTAAKPPPLAPDQKPLKNP